MFICIARIKVFLGPCIFHFLILTILEILYANKCIILNYTAIIKEAK